MFRLSSRAMKCRSILKYHLIKSGFILFLLCFGNHYATAQTANEFFVGGANMYINGQTGKAKEYVSYGLSKFPDNKKLLALKRRIDEEKPDQNQDKNKDQNGDNKNQNKDKKDQNKDQNKDNKDQHKDQQQQQQQDQQTISKEDAQRLLDALANDEKKVQEKVKQEKAARARVKTIINW
jgi:hypothetical protein